MTKLIMNKLDEICDITDITGRINKLQSLFPSWDNTQLHEFAEKGCDTLSSGNVEELVKTTNEIAIQQALKIFNPPGGLPYLDGLMVTFITVMSAYALWALLSYLIRKIKNAR